MQIRSRLTTAFVRPLLDWASPLMAPGTFQDASLLLNAICKPTVSWWCEARFWAQQVDNHPLFGVAIRGLLNAFKILPTACSKIRSVLLLHAQALKLQIVEFNHDHLVIRTSSNAVHCGRNLVTMLPISCNPLRCAQVGVLTQPGRTISECALGASCFPASKAPD